MSNESFKAKVYVKEGCPFSLKLLVFLAEARLLDDVEIVRLDPARPDFDATKARLTEGLGKPATFPTVEIEPGRYMSDSDALVEHFARAYGVRPEALRVFPFYKETVFPQIAALHAHE
ncbi:MAG: glutathione S-transferase domain-containing protein [Gammaproteobacteria bacterium]|nr:hypothetical protein [Gammaproteobacteria bacterium]